jgi:TrmH family RNA methyltransferase
MAITITSHSNSRIRAVERLAKHAERARRRLTIVEGERECTRALDAGVIPHEAYLCRELLTPAGRSLAARLERFDQTRQTLLVEVPADLFAKLAYRGASGGILLVIPHVAQTLATLHLPEPGFVAVIEGVEKPGNLGAILRTADAAGLHAVIVTAGATDLHNPNVVRASLGTLFTVQVAEASSADTIQWLQAHNIQIVGASPAARMRYTEVDYTGPVAVVMGAEATGLSDAWAEAADALVHIPMFGQADSLNLAVSTALLLYEVVRQRDSQRPD